MNPLSRILAGLLGVLALVGAFFFGLVVLAVAIGLGVLAWLFVALRMWWLRRRWQGQSGPGGAPGPPRPGASAQRETDVIDADYEVVSRQDEH
jgi:uncharacterized iron-regulated membrane protein